MCQFRVLCCLAWHSGVHELHLVPEENKTPKGFTLWRGNSGGDGPHCCQVKSHLCISVTPFWAEIRRKEKPSFEV